MRLEQIGFYTLNDARAKNASATSPMQRCEILITDRCNFKCPYCRGFSAFMPKGDASCESVTSALDNWIADGLVNVRFSGGEPTTHPNLSQFVSYCKSNGVERIAVSTNGSRPNAMYRDLIELGVNDFSISLDACCADFGNKMAGVAGKWERVIGNIRRLSERVYVTVGIVVTEETADTIVDVIRFAHDLGVADIRIISAAQYNQKLWNLDRVPTQILDAHPILAYRVEHFLSGRNVRGIVSTDCHKCHLVKDDSMIVGVYHYPCVIYAREGGIPIGRVSSTMREERTRWFDRHNSYADPICRKNCLDVCIDYNNRVRELNRG